MSMTETRERWHAILCEEVEKTTVQQVANTLGYSRPAISLARAGKYTAEIDKIAAKVLEVYSDRILCPHLQADITPATCVEYHTTPIPMSDPQALKHWQRCQTCKHNQSLNKNSPHDEEEMQ